jgi:hypothetical protein
MRELKLFEYLAELDDREGYGYEDGLQLTALWIRKNLIEVEQLFPVFHPFFTLHDHSHNDAVVNHLYQIISLALPEPCERQLAFSI